MSSLETPRLRLVPLTLGIVEAVIGGRRDDAESLVGARMPERWPNRELVERAFSASLDAIRDNPAVSLWGDRVLIARGGERDARVLGSVIFHGKPADDGIAEIAYGVEEASQGQGYATEAVAACVAWALAQSDVRAVQAATFGWHRASLRVIEKVGMRKVGLRDHETMGQLLVFERRRG
ncbi:MAG TPA: GNAT family protein [Polyangiaceae bacterium]|nr:GNAT family protein [Polyangiaceae bacterium]